MPDHAHPSQVTKPPGAVAMDTDCVACVHLRDDATCPAYPEGVPGPVYHGFLRHDVVLPDQIGDVVFAPCPDAEVGWLDADGNEVE